MQNIRQAHKRAKHFATPFDGPYTSLDPCGRNMAALLEDADYLSGLSVLDMWARIINKACDTEHIQENEQRKNMMGAFLSRLWFNPECMR